MNISVILCTYNRAESLGKTLESFTSMRIMEGIEWELIIVDNNSSDHTREICRRFEKDLPIRYVLEPKQGKSYALNHGIQVALGDLIAFTDDDVNVDSYWLNALWEGAEQHPQASFFGGPVSPQWETPPPAWIIENSTGSFAGIWMYYEKKSDCKFLQDSEFPVGANMMFRRDVFEKGYRFSVDIGPSGNESTRQEDTLLIKEVLKARLSGAYLSDAKIYHRNSRARMTESYVRKWCKGAGISAVRLRQVAPSKHILLGAPRYLWRALLESGLRYLLSRWTKPSSVWLCYETQMARTWGMIAESRRQFRENINNAG